MIFWALAHVFARPKVLDFDSCFRGPRIFISWIIFFRGPWVFWDLAQFFKEPMVLDPGVFRRPRIFRSWILFFRGPRVFWAFGSCFQKTKGSRSWLMFLEDLGYSDLGSCFSEDQGFWASAHVFRRPKVLDPGSCF